MTQSLSSDGFGGSRDEGQDCAVRTSESHGKSAAHASEPEVRSSRVMVALHYSITLYHTA